MTLPLLALCVLIAFTLEAMTGFGSVVIAVSLASLLLPLEQIVPAVVPLNVVMGTVVLAREYRHIQWRLLLGRILPLMAVGTVAGYLLLPKVEPQLLKLLFGLLLVAFSSRELWQLYRQRWQPLPPRVTPVMMLGAGVTHGLFASGGPLLMIALAGSTLSKAALRATLISVWWTLNLCLTLAFWVDGRLQPQLPTVAVLVLCLPVAVGLGNYWHGKVDEGRFKQVIYSILATVGVFLALSTL